MTKDELITKQQLQIEGYKEKLKENKELVKQAIGMCYNIGQPLNDNVLKMNNPQMKWCFDICNIIKEIN